MRRKELWEDIPGYEGLYKISNFGKIKSLAKVWVSGNGRICKKRDTILKQILTKKGYMNIGLCKNGKQSTYKVHRLVGIVFIPNPENKPQINHKKGNKRDNRAWMLEWHTSSENIKHCFKIGLKSFKGEKNNAAKLTRKQVDQILQFEGLMTQSKIAKKFNVTQGTINHIFKKTTWKTNKL